MRDLSRGMVLCKHMHLWRLHINIWVGNRMRHLETTVTVICCIDDKDALCSEYQCKNATELSKCM